VGDAEFEGGEVAASEVIADVGGRKAELTGEEFHGRASGRACRLARASLA